jgi:type I restriction enzyme S subunit
MKNNWKKDELGNLIEYCARGVSPSYTEGAGVIVLNQKCIRDNKISLEPSRITDSKKKKISEEKYLKKFDILVNSTGVGTLGRVAQFKGSNEMMTADSHVTIVRPDDKKIDPFFLGYVMSFKQVEIEKMGVGATGQTELSRNTLKELKIGYPEKIEDQKKIADVLSAHDDLIENNNRRIKILEEMAQLIYKEWFVDFKFPGHEKVKMVEGELGLMPEDWEVKKIKDLINIKSGFAFSSAVYNNEDGYGLVTIKNVQDAEFITRCTTRISSVPKNMPEHCFLREGDIILSLTGNIGRVCLVYGDKYLLNQRVAKLVPIKDEYNSFIYFLFRESEFKNKLEMVSNGVAQQNLSPIEMGEIKIIFPANNYMEMFHENVRYIIETIIVLKNKNNILRQTRDLLLSKLMSGEINL